MWSHTLSRRFSSILATFFAFMALHTAFAEEVVIELDYNPYREFGACTAAIMNEEEVRVAYGDALAMGEMPREVIDAILLTDETCAEVESQILALEPNVTYVDPRGNHHTREGIHTAYDAQCTTYRDLIRGDGSPH